MTAGLQPEYRLNFLAKRKYEEGIGLLSPDETKKELENIRGHSAPIGISSRFGFGVIVRKIAGLEFIYEDLLTNALKGTFEFRNAKYPTNLTYSRFKVMLTFRLIHSDEKFLDWDR